MMDSDKLLQLWTVTALKGSLVLATGWFCLYVFKRASASARHWVCSLTLISAIVIPIFASIAPAWAVPILPSAVSSPISMSVFDLAKPLLQISQQSDVDSKPRAVTDSSASPNTVVNVASSVKPPAVIPSSILAKNTVPAAQAAWPALLVLMWAAGAVVILLRGVNLEFSLYKISRFGTELTDPAWIDLREELTSRLKIRRGVALIVCDKVRVPFTWGFWQPIIFLPTVALSWSSERRRIVLLHELVHIARRDTLTQWLALISCAVNWFNPLVWNLTRKLAVERERACDDQVLGLGTKSSDYASNLLEISHMLRLNWLAQSGILAMGQSSDLAQRIRHILDRGQSRHTMTRTRSICLLLLVAIAVLPFSTMQLSPAAAQNNSTTISLALPPGIKDQMGDHLVADFESAHPGVTVALVEASDVGDPVDDLDGYYTALQKYANSADVLLTESFGGAMSVMPQATRAGYFLDLAPLVNGDASLKVDDFYPQMWKSFQWDNGVWALPVSGDLAVFSYDPAAFDQAGIAYPDGNWTLSDFANAVTKLTIKDADGHITRAGFANSGRVFRLALWQSLLGIPLYDDRVIPNQPQFQNPQVEAVLATYHQLEAQGAIGGDPGEAAMIVDDVAHAASSTRHAALLPGNKAGLMALGVAVSAGTQHPDLAYELAKFITIRPEMNLYRIPARTSIAASAGKDSRLSANQALVDQGLSNAMPLSDMRFTGYLNAAGVNSASNAHEAVHEVEQRAFNDLKAADAKKGTLVLAVVEPTAPVLPAGKIALKFDLSTGEYPLSTKDQWDRVIQEFTASDPQVGMVKLRTLNESVDTAAAQSDCFYLPTNAVAMAGNGLLNLDPFLNADPTFDKNDLVGNVFSSVQRDNKTYALPINIEPLILRYDSARFSAASLPEPTNTWTVESFADALQALKAGGDGQGPFVDAESNGTYLLVLMADYGGVPLDYRTSPPTINFTDPANVTAMKQVLDLAKNGLIRYGALGNLTDGPNIGPNNTTAIYPGRLNGFLGRKIPRGAAPDKAVLFPAGHDTTGLAYRVGTAYISAQSQNPEACYRFISTIAQHMELFNAMPARPSQLSSPSYASATSPDVLALYNQVNTLLQDSRTIPIPTFEKGDINVSDFLLQHWLFEAFDAYVIDGHDLDAALKDAETYAKAYQECSAALPPFSLLSTNNGPSDIAKAYIDCAEKADGRLKPVLDPLAGR